MRNSQERPAIGQLIALSVWAVLAVAACKTSAAHSVGAAGSDGGEVVARTSASNTAGSSASGANNTAGGRAGTAADAATSVHAGQTRADASTGHSVAPPENDAAVGGTHGGTVHDAAVAVTSPLNGTVRVAYLRHSTGGVIWDGGVEEFIASYASAHGKSYPINKITYPDTSGGYPWANYAYDYWNLWVAHQGTSRDRGELNLDDLAKDYDVIMFKHCFPMSAVEADEPSSSVSSEAKTLANYKLQYAALKARMHSFPQKRFLVWTGAALTVGDTNPANAQRAKEFFDWVKTTWDEPGDNIYVWDFYALETEGTLYLKPEYAAGANDSHPNATFATMVAPYIGQRIIDVIEGRGDTGSLTGK